MIFYGRVRRAPLIDPASRRFPHATIFSQFSSD
jgi:hypothetical protein